MASASSAPSGKLENWPLQLSVDEAEGQRPASMICNNLETRVCSTRQGRGIACLPDFSVNSYLANGELCRVLPEHARRRNVFNILWPANKHPSPKVRALVDFLNAKVFASDI